MSVRELTPLEQAKLTHAKSTARLIGLYVPLGLTAVIAALMLIWVPRLPNPMAVHWNGAGVADGFDSPWLSVVMFPAMSLVVTSLFFLQHLQSWQATQRPGTPVWGAMNRLMPAIVLGSATFIFVLSIGTTIPQLDLVDARGASLPSVNPVMFGAFGAAIVAGLVGYFVQPKLRIDPQVDAEKGQQLDLTESERAVWLGTAKASKAYFWLIGIGAATMLGTTALMFSVRPIPWVGVAITLATTLLVAWGTLMCARFSVRIDDDGLTARALTGWPTFRVPAADVERVDVGEIVPFAEFGGWGLRFVGGGSVGIVLRTGEGLRISRKSGKSLAITIDDADTAAAVLNAVSARATANASQE